MLLFFILLILLSLALVMLLVIPLLIARFLLSVFFLLLIIPLVAVIAYWYLGGAKLIQELLHQQQQTVEVQAKLSEFSSPLQVIEALKASLKTNPNKAQGWYLLGKLYLDQENYAQAAAALAEANRLEQNKPETMLAYAEALFFLNHESLIPRVSQLLNAVLEAQPNNLDALNLFAVGAYNAQEYSVAIHYWRQILSLLPENSPNRKPVLNMLNKASELGKKK